MLNYLTNLRTEIKFRKKKAEYAGDMPNIIGHGAQLHLINAIIDHVIERGYNESEDGNKHIPYVMDDNNVDRSRDDVV
jgi:hypothetical protein